MGCHAYCHGSWWCHFVEFLDVIQNLLNNVADVIPLSAKVVHTVPPYDKNIIMTKYYVSPLPSPPNLRVTCLWLSTGCLLLDFQHARFSQDLHISHGTPLVVRSYRKSTRSRVFKKSIPQRSCLWSMLPLPPVNIPCTCPCLTTCTDYWTYSMYGSAMTCTWAVASSGGQQPQGNTS